MQKMQIHTQVILGAILLITAFTGIKVPAAGSLALSPLSLGAAMPAKAAPIQSQTEITNAALPIIDCTTCHNSIIPMPLDTNTPENEQSILLQNHTGSIVQCVSCHTETPEMSISQMGEP